MTEAWSEASLAELARTQTVHISSRRNDGSDSPWWPIWVVVVDGDVFVRSTDGARKVWFRNARRRGSGMIRAADHTFEIGFEDPSAELAARITDAYRTKYRESSAWSLNRAMTSTATLRLVPKD